MKQLQWVFRIFDQASGPAKAMGNALDNLAKKFRGSGDHVRGFMDRLKDLFFIKEAVGLVAELGRKLHELGAEILTGIAFKQNSVIALTALRGSRDAAIEVYDQVEDFAWKTGQTVASVMMVTKDLLSAGLDPGQARYMQQLIGDLNIIDPSKAQSMAGILADVNRMGELTGRQLHALRGLIPLADLAKEVSGIVGFNVTLEDMEKRGVKAGTAIDALARVMLRLFSKGKAGSLMAEQAGTLPYLLKKVAGIPERVMDELAGFKRGAGGSVFEAILKNIADTFDPTGPSGERIISSLRGLMARIGAAFGVGDAGGLLAELAGPNGMKKVEEIFTSMVKKLENAIPTIQAVASGLWEIAKAMAWLVSKTGDVGKFVRDVTGLSGAAEKSAPRVPMWAGASAFSGLPKSQQDALEKAAGGEADAQGLRGASRYLFTNQRKWEMAGGLSMPHAQYEQLRQGEGGGATLPALPWQNQSRATTSTANITANFNISGATADDGDAIMKTITEGLADALDQASLRLGVQPAGAR